MEKKKASVQLSDGTIKFVDFDDTPFEFSEEDQLLAELDEDNLQNVFTFKELKRFLKGKRP